MKTLQMFAVVTPGLEPVCARELQALGLERVQVEPGGVAFEGGLGELYLANLMLRSASRVLVRLGRFGCRDFPTLYKRALRLPWGAFVRPGTALSVRTSCHASRLIHTQRIAETIAAAACHSLGLAREEMEKGSFSQLLVVRLEEDEALLSLDSSGELLHRRGWRTAQLEAPLRESLAAGILQLLGWDGTVPLLDPMCGSGTFPIEAAWLAMRFAPGERRDFAFMRWPHFRPGLWQVLLDEAKSRRRPLSVPISGMDRALSAIAVAKENAHRAGVEDAVYFACGELSALEPETARGFLIANPPYGKRLGRGVDLVRSYRALGRALKGAFAGWEGAFLCPDPALARETGLKLEKVALLAHGGLNVALLKVLRQKNMRIPA
ncbi:MAG: class I SAM-dependent RNA methyltransferase [Deltaproteobacteria bacterium]|nr:class I SAM-dependent RNA methyltransferase [Deltaproteobacteria bacterium]